MKQSANVIIVCTTLDKPLSNDKVLNLQSLTGEKDLNNNNNGPLLRNIEPFLCNIVPFVGINVPLLHISITQEQKRPNEVINNCK